QVFHDRLAEIGPLHEQRRKIVDENAGEWILEDSKRHGARDRPRRCLAGFAENGFLGYCQFSEVHRSVPCFVFRNRAALSCRIVLAGCGENEPQLRSTKPTGSGSPSGNGVSLPGSRWVGSTACDSTAARK